MGHIVRAIHSWTDETATIGVQGLRETVRMLHVTDSHIALVDGRDAEHEDVCKPIQEDFGRVRQDSNGKDISTEETFDETMTEAGQLGLDLVALTGDIVHFPAQASIECATRLMAKAGVPMLYTAGNHDWHFGDLSGREELREAWWPALAPLLPGPPACDRYVIGGIQFLLVDDSTYQINEAQLCFVQTYKANGMPTVLLVHVPLSIPTLRDPTIARWEAPILIGDPDWDIESRESWQAGEDRAETIEFIRSLVAADSLVAVFSGHVHFPHTDAINLHAVQYVGAAGYEGRKRLVEFCPL